MELRCPLDDVLDVLRVRGAVMANLRARGPWGISLPPTPKATLHVDASKVRADSVGRQTPIPMDDLVEVGVFAERTRGGGLGETLYLEQHRIRSGKGTITVVVPRRPALAGVDPYRKLIERERDDNLATVALPAP